MGGGLPSTYEGVDFLRFGEGKNLGHTFSNLPSSQVKGFGSAPLFINRQGLNVHVQVYVERSGSETLTWKDGFL